MSGDGGHKNECGVEAALEVLFVDIARLGPVRAKREFVTRYTRRASVRNWFVRIYHLIATTTRINAHFQNLAKLPADRQYQAH